VATVTIAFRGRLRPPKTCGDQVCFSRAFELRVEVLSLGDTETEMREKMTLNFDAGSQEVWQCDSSGNVRFFIPAAQQPGAESQPRKGVRGDPFAVRPLCRTALARRSCLQL
jgi:Uma2 family endonuclease